MPLRPQWDQSREGRPRVGAACALAFCLIAATSTQPAGASITAEHSKLQQSNGRDFELMGDSRTDGGSPKMSIPDEELIDQNGNAIHLYRDLIKGRVVVVSFMFTSCGFICPMQTIALTKLQNALGARLGKDVHFVSVSLDPQIDNPERLKDWAVKFGAKSGWTFVTGDKARIDRVARAFTGGPAEKGDHSEALFIGNDSTQVWLRANGLAATERLKEMVDRVSGPADSRSGSTAIQSLGPDVHLPESQRAR